MTQPKIATTAPFMMEVVEGKNYAWCTCGESSNQPLCDGSHTGSPFTPKIFRAESNKKVALCGCKHTKNPPYCDGSHSAF